MRLNRVGGALPLKCLGCNRPAHAHATLKATEVMKGGDHGTEPTLTLPDRRPHWRWVRRRPVHVVASPRDEPPFDDAFRGTTGRCPLARGKAAAARAA